MSCKVCLMRIESDGNFSYRLCGSCYSQLHSIRHELIATKDLSWTELTEEAIKVLKERFRRGKLQPMKMCEYCGEKVHAYADNDTTKMLSIKICPTCFTKAHNDWINTDDGYDEILQRMKNAKRENKIPKEPTHEPTPVNPKRVKPLTYREMEYDFVNVSVLEFENEQDELRVLNELMDIALLGNDIEWAKSLHKQIRTLKGENVQ